HLVSIMDHTPGQGQYKDIDKYVAFMVKWLGGSADDFDPEFLKERIRARVASEQAKPWSWDVVNETLHIAKAHCIAVASHDDDTKEKVTRLASMGVTISEFPVTLEAAITAKEHGQYVAMGAPNALRGYSHSGNLSSLDAVKAEVVDILATDYYPATCVHAAFEIADQKLLPLHEAIKLVTLNPANAVGLMDRGRIEVGARADLAIVEEGVNRRVRGTIRQGKPIFWDNVMMERSAFLPIVNKAQ